MAGKNSGVVEWTIENLSCWNEKLHGECIASPKFNFSAKFKVSLQQGSERRMVVRVERTRRNSPAKTGQLFWMRSDDTIIHTQMVNREAADDLGTPFEEVVALLTEHEDQLTLRYEFEDSRNFKESMCTVIEVLDVTLKLDVESIKSGGTKSDIDYSRTKKPAMLYLRSAVLKDKEAELTLEPSGRKRIHPCFVRTLVRFAKGRDDDPPFHIKEHLFCDATPWVVMEMREMREGSTHVLLRLKIAGGTLAKKNFLREHDWKEETDTKAVHFSGGKSSPSLYFDVSHDSAPTKYSTKDSHDLQLRCGGFTFRVHRGILSSLSPVFKTMLSSNDSETLDITDLDPSTLDLFLTHLYTGTAGELQYESALKLLLAADKYQVSSLEKECDAFFADDDDNKYEHVVEESESGSPPGRHSMLNDHRRDTGAEEASRSAGKSSTSLDSNASHDSATSCTSRDSRTDFSDLQLRCEGLTFPVNKAALSTRSLVFRTIGSSDMTKLDVENMDPPTLRLFLTYLYTGVVEDLQEHSALKLYYAAKRFQVPSLKRDCLVYLSNDKCEPESEEDGSPPSQD